MLSEIKGLRSPARQQNPNRKPVILPSSLRLQVFLIPFPYLYPTEERRYSIFASAVTDLREQMAKSPSCVADFACMLEAAQIIDGDEDLAGVAVELGGTTAVEDEEDYGTTVGCLKM
jgi:hypothetical protein